MRRILRGGDGEPKDRRRALPHADTAYDGYRDVQRVGRFAGAERSARAFDIGAGLSCRMHAANADTPYIGQRVARRA